MRQDDDGRDAMQVRRYAPGERVRGALDDCPGTVLSVDDKFDTFIVQWDGTDFPVVYPVETIMIRKSLPWET